VFPPCSPRKIQKEASDQRSSDSKRFKVAKRSKAVDDEEYSVMRNVYSSGGTLLKPGTP
jgi:hypothetical protein